MNNEIQELLLKIGITPNLRGFNYIVDAVLLIASDKSKYWYVTKELYPKIAEMYNSTPTRIERCIRHAITKSIDHDYGEMEKILGVSPYQIKMTNSEFLHLMLRKAKESK